MFLKYQTLDLTMNFVAIIIIFAALIRPCCCKNCVTDDACKCTFDDNSGMIDLWSTARTDGFPLAYDEVAPDGYLYSYNPCIPFSEGTCADVAVCQYVSQDFGNVDLGLQESASFSFDGLSVIAEYTSADDSRKTHVTLICDPAATTPTVAVQGESSPLNYYMTLTSVAACPVPVPLSGISAGSVLLIIFFSLLVVYLAVGLTLNKVKAGKSGAELIPNLAFWTQFPSLIKEGFGFSIGLICRKRTYGAV